MFCLAHAGHVSAGDVSAMEGNSACRCYTSVLLLLWLATSAADIVSRKSCEDLKSRVGNWRTFGSPNICGASKVAPGGVECLLEGMMAWEEAVYTCEIIGMRLCTPQELLDDEAKQTGCQMDIKRTWTSERCDSGTRAISQAGASDYIGTHPSKCNNLNARNGVRCCADAAQVSEPTACRGDPCNSRLNPSNRCEPLSDVSYVCVCEGDGYIVDTSRQSCQSAVCVDKCSTDRYKRNQCVDNRDGTYTCSCSFPYVVAGDFQSCQVSTPTPRDTLPGRILFPPREDTNA